MAKLAAYRAKRDFARTPEPSGEGDVPAGAGVFVVQKHAATRLHYDLRLELDGVMKSWAVTKGPSLVASEKRLSVHVEDHPTAYNSFEGTIPKGQYGGGTVMIWDRGLWTPEEDPHRGYAKGHLKFRLDGEKLRGAWHLVRLRRKPTEKQESWLLLKVEDEWARPHDASDILDDAPLSVATGRSLDEIRDAPAGAVWDTSRGIAHEAREAKAEAVEPAGKSAVTTATRKTRREPAEEAADPMPQAVEPCLATPAASVPAGAGWLHEIKWDGYRLLAFKQGARVRLATRRGHDWTSRFPAIAAAIAAVKAETVILDGEAVIADENGMSSFSALQAALGDMGGKIASEAVFYAFDLLYADGADLRPFPLDDRKARLAPLVAAAGADALRLSEHMDHDGPAMVKSACRLGLEGVISKRRDRPYRSGRGEDWLKIKCTDRQEFAVVGYTESAAGARAVGSLVLGYNEGGALKLAGRTGTGFTAAVARDLWKRLQPDRRATTPTAGRLTAEERRGVVFVEPRLVAEVEFRGWTGDDHLRHAAFKGLREDKTPDEVVRERPADPPPASASEPSAETPPVADAPASSPSSPSSRRKASGGRAKATVAGVALTHPDRVLWEDAVVTKQGLAEFYVAIADRLLPHVAGRPLSLVRCPSGAEGKCFFQKHSWAGLGDAIRRETMRDDGGEEEVLYVEDIAGVVSLVQAGVLEIHPWGASIADVDRPDRITMDLDPGDGVEWPAIAAAAREVRARLDGFGLRSFVKTTGGKGLHVVVPLSGRTGWADVKSWTRDLALALERDAPDRYIARATKQARRGLIYVDYLRNGRGATAVAAYSTRARPGAPVSVPVDWSEIEGASRPAWTVATLAERLKDRDPWAEIETVTQDIPSKSRSAKS